MPMRARPCAGPPTLASHQLAPARVHRRRLEPHPAELALLDVLSWLPERVAAAARGRRPAELAAFLKVVAAAWLDCREACPALPFGGRAAPADPGGPQTAARLEFAAATSITLAAGLALLGLTAPARM